MADYDSYVICTSPRSGSTLLCKMLAATGVAGRPGSHFHEPALASWLAEYEIAPGPDPRETLMRVFAAALARGRGDTGMFGLRLQRHSWGYFVEQLALLHPGLGSDQARFEAAFGRTKFIYLTRPDKIEQAVSIVKAEQTGLWHRAPDGTEIERLGEPAEPVYDVAALHRHVEVFERYDREWRDWFDEVAVTPFRITYDELSADPIAVLRRVLDELGLDPRVADAVVPGVAKLADATTAEWARRLRAELQA